MKWQYVNTVKTILFYLRLMTIIVSLFVIYSVIHDVNEQRDFQRMHTCDAYAYDKVNAPSFCNF